MSQPPAPKIMPTKKKREGQPPAFWSLHLAWNAQGNSEHQRFGQWFICKYMPNAHGEIIDQLWNTSDIWTATRIIIQLYDQYQWEMT
jgi:hypothetical protein